MGSNAADTCGSDALCARDINFEASSRLLIRRRLEILWVPVPPLAGALFGLLAPLPEDSAGIPEPWRRVSAVLGWSYFCAWSVSFYPQVVQNLQRRSVVGLSLDYQLLNFAGFLCYFVFNAALYWSSSVQREYEEQHSGNRSAVRLNDVVFAGHAALLTLVTLVQIAAFYDYPPGDEADRMLRRAVVVGLSGLGAVSLVLAIVVVVSSERVLTWLTYILVLSEVKVVISTMKYCPQVWMNCRRRSTDGWSISNVLLDFTGGSLSVAQLLLDAWACRDWSAVLGDPAKLMLGNVSMVFDVVFMVQHYCLYAHRRPE